MTERRRPCRIQQWSDETVCTVCQLRWDTNDPEPPKCPKEGKRK